MSTVFSKFESDTHKAANDYFKRTELETSSRTRAKRILATFVDFKNKKTSQAGIAAKIHSQLTTQRRWAKAGHPDYDINRHLGLIEAMNYLDQLQIDKQKPPTVSSQRP